MSILCDSEIEAENIITPFEPEQVREKNGEKVISYGVSSFGYDIRLGKHFRSVGKPFRATDPKKEIDADSFLVPDDGEPLLLPAGSCVLGVSFEHFQMPEDVLGVCYGKSTYARCGIIVNVTPLEPEWKGHLTIEIHNSSRADCMLYPGEGIAQVVFFRGEPPETTYAERGGKYQDQGPLPCGPR